jgi:hypothetical protein
LAEPTALNDLLQVLFCTVRLFHTLSSSRATALPPQYDSFMTKTEYFRRALPNAISCPILTGEWFCRDL